jgi:hypothetical protein
VDQLKIASDEQTLSSIMVKIAAANREQWSVSQPTWMREEVEVTFARFVEQKWKDALNVVAAESAGCGISIADLGKTTSSSKKVSESRVAAVEISAKGPSPLPPPTPQQYCPATPPSHLLPPTRTSLTNAVNVYCSTPARLLSNITSSTSIAI